MRVVVVSVGRVKGPIGSLVAEYERRASRYWKFDAIEVPAGGRGSAGPDQIREAEGERILSKVPTGLSVVALTRGGTSMDSVELSRYLDELGVRSEPGVAFVIGGAFGLADHVLEASVRTLSLSTMTFPHELARLFLAEQLYRAGTIRRGEPYHKG